MNNIIICFVFLSTFSFIDKGNVAIDKFSGYEINKDGHYISATPEMFGYEVGGDEELNNAALQNLFDTTVNISLSTQVYITNSILDIDQNIANQVIVGNGATIQAGSNINIVIRIKKTDNGGGSTKISDLIIDGDGLASVGFQVWSAVDFDDMEVHDMFQFNTVFPAAGIWCEIYNDSNVYAFGDWTFDNMNIHDVNTIGDDDPFNANGSADGVLIFHREIISPSNSVDIIFKDSQIHDSFGAGGQNAGLFSPGLDVSYQGVDIIFDNVDFYGWERRSIKAFCGNLTFRNGSNTEVQSGDARITHIYEPAGMFVVAANSGATGASNILIENWEFIGNTDAEYEEKVYLIDTDNVTMRNVTFSNGADLSIGGVLSNLEFCGITMGAGSVIEQYGSPPSGHTDNGGIVFSTNNVYSVGSPFSNITSFSVTESLLTCDPPITPPATNTQISISRKKSYSIIPLIQTTY